jgi:DNA-binding response OmpR family regulator
MICTKVLIIEDDLNWLDIFYTLVGNDTKELFEYVHVGDLASALSIKKDSFGLIILDLMLPDSEAENTIKTMTTQVNYIPIVVITTMDDEKLIQHAFDKGIDDYLVKDQYDTETFIHVCRQAIKRFVGRTVQGFDEDIKKLICHLQSVDANLEKWQQKSVDPPLEPNCT